jgi:glutathione S-transferase
MKDTLYLLRPGFDDGGTPYFCPYCAQVMGFLSYFPHVRDTLEIVEVDFAKPRRPLADVLGEANQSAPKLVLGDGAADVPGVEISEANGRRFVTDTMRILKYLAATRGTPTPH